MLQFVRFRDFGHGKVAEFESEYDFYLVDGIGNTNIIRLDKPSLKTRITNLEKRGEDTSVERIALEQM
jgi:hypothetical protein